MNKNKLKQKTKIGYVINITRTLLYNDHDRNGYWKTECSNTVPEYATNVLLYDVKEKINPDVVTTLKFKHGQLVYLLWVEWSGGDSFGVAINSNTETIGLFADKNSAEELKEVILKANEEKEYSSIKYQTSDGQSFDFFPDWHYYFEKLETVNITPIAILNK